jgi:hypothetical protein
VNGVNVTVTEVWMSQYNLLFISDVQYNLVKHVSTLKKKSLIMHVHVYAQFTGLSDIHIPI